LPNPCATSCFLLHILLMIPNGIFMLLLAVMRFAYEISCLLQHNLLMRLPYVKVIGLLFLWQCLTLLTPSTETSISGTSQKLWKCLLVSEYVYKGSVVGLGWWWWCDVKNGRQVVLKNAGD
jgi:hypothetical protein